MHASYAPTILIFDSGLGGLTVFREVVKARPDARYVYVADDAFFPYGRHEAAALIARLVPLMGKLIAEHRPDLVVIACNTASTLVLTHLRAAYSVPFVGTVPAIKPACTSSKSRLVSVLGTEATVAREYTRKLIRDFGQGCEIALIGSARLASLAEAALRDEPVEDAAILAEITPCFIERDGRRTDTIVLACTHYPLLLDRFERLAPWPVAWIDPAPAIARRVVQLLGPADAANVAARGARDRIVFTSDRPPSQALAKALARYGLRADGAAVGEPDQAALRLGTSIDTRFLQRR
jgi:glutamate racemase